LPRLVEAEAHGFGTRVGPKFDGPGQARQAEGFRAACRQDAIPDRRHRLR
jgi:hypothetical protein